MFTPRSKKPQNQFLMRATFFGWVLLLNPFPIAAQITSTDVSPIEIEIDLALPLRQKSTESLSRKIHAESLYFAGVLQQLTRKNLEALRTLQRSYRAAPNAGLLRDILLLTNRLRLKNEFVRYSEFSGGVGLVDQKLILNAALALTDQRKYESAILFYQRWLDVGTQPPANLYLKLLIQIEVGRLRYLTKQFEFAARDFQQVLDQLDLVSTNQRQQLLRNASTTYRMMGNAFLKQGSIELAERLFRRADVDTSPAIRLQDESAIALANSDLETAEKKIIQSISKENNDSESYDLLQRIFEAKIQNESAFKQAMVDQLVSIRKRFKTGKVLDERLVELYIDLGQTSSAIEILVDQRSGTIYRDLANRKLLDLAVQELDASRFLDCLLIEVDEHENLLAIRRTLRNAAENKRFVECYEQFRGASKLTTAGRFASELFFMFVPASDQTPNPEILEQHLRELDSALKKRNAASCFALEAFATKRYEMAVIGIKKCQQFNRDQTDKVIDRQRQFENILGLVVSHTLQGEFGEARVAIDAASKLQASSASVSHLHAWLDLQNGRFDDAIDKYSSFLSNNDKSGMPQSLFQLIERARLELALSFVLIDRDDLAIEIIKQAFDSNPLGPDRSSFDRNNQRYAIKFKRLESLIGKVKNGGPFLSLE